MKRKVVIPAVIVLAEILLFLFLWLQKRADVQIIATSGEAAVNIGGDEKKIALTFDDGPHPVYTKQLLDGLKERDVKVTFFVTGEHAENK